jgi:hypothetical protein
MNIIDPADVGFGEGILFNVTEIVCESREKEGRARGEGAERKARKSERGARGRRSETRSGMSGEWGIE